MRRDEGARRYVIASTGPPTITGPLTASGFVGVPFSYTITADSSRPIMYTVAPLPAGLSLQGAMISDTPATPRRATPLARSKETC